MYQIRVKIGEGEKVMKQMKKRWRMLVPTVLLLAMTFSTTVFAAEEELEYVPDLHATF